MDLSIYSIAVSGGFDPILVTYKGVFSVENILQKGTYSTKLHTGF